MKVAQNFRDNVDKTSYLHDSVTLTVNTAADKWLEICETTGRKGREPVENDPALQAPRSLHQGNDRGRSAKSARPRSVRTIQS